MNDADLFANIPRPPVVGEMPVFTIKARDLLAVPAIRHYQTLCSAYGLHEQAAEVEKAIQEMTVWIRANPSELKLPDHPHVPTGGAS